MSLSDEDENRIFCKLKDTSGLSDSVVADEYDITISKIEEIMANNNYERCPNCDWWVGCCELADENNEPCFCNSCR